MSTTCTQSHNYIHICTYINIYIYIIYIIYIVYISYIYIYIYIYIIFTRWSCKTFPMVFEKSNEMYIKKSKNQKSNIYIYIFIFIYIYIYMCVCVCVCVCGVCIKVNYAFNRILEKASRPDLSTQMKKISPFTN